MKTLARRDHSMRKWSPKDPQESGSLRPIVSSINSVTYKIAKLLATILAPLV